MLGFPLHKGARCICLRAHAPSRELKALHIDKAMLMSCLLYLCTPSHPTLQKQPSSRVYTILAVFGKDCQCLPLLFQRTARMISCLAFALTTQPTATTHKSFQALPAVNELPCPPTLPSPQPSYAHTPAAHQCQRQCQLQAATSNFPVSSQVLWVTAALLPMPMAHVQVRQ